jgi:hypothetical protein
MGWYTVEECSRQASTGNLKIKCYNKLLSDYLDAKANSLIEKMASDLGSHDKATLKGIMDALLEDYQITPKLDDPISIAVATPSGERNEYFGGASFKMIGSSTTYHPVMYYGYASFMYVKIAGLSTKRLKIDDMSRFTTKLNASVNNFKEELRNQIQDYQTFWNQLKKQKGIGEFFGVMVGTADENAGGLYTRYTEYIPDELYDKNTTGTGSWDPSMLPQDRYPLSELKYLSNVDFIKFTIPSKIWKATSATATPSSLWGNTIEFNEDDLPVIYAVENDDIDNITIELSDLPEVTLRELTSANYELHCAFGRLERTTDLFGAVELNHSRLYPADDLYPANDLYPLSYSERSNRAMYSKLWADEGNVRSFRYLIITYKSEIVDPDTGTVSEVEKTLQRTVNEHGTDNYNMSDNWLFRNLIWDDATVGDYADAMVQKLQNVTWFPFEMWCAGLPYIETGDEVEINMDEGAYTSYVLRRTLKGIQNLQDQMINGTLDIF